MSLTVYKKKRDFGKTPEPEGKVKKRHKQLSFVIQRHDASRLHYDFRLEMEGVLKSWAVPKGPSMKAGDRRLAVMVEDHPLDYGKFYGEIPKGNYGAGTVDIWDEGTYEAMEKPNKGSEENHLLAQLEKGDLKFTMHGHYLKGSFALVRMNDGEGKNWLLIKKKDEYALPSYDAEKIKSIKLHTSKKAGVHESNRKVIGRATEKPVKAKAIASKKKERGSTPAKLIDINKVWPNLQQPMLAKLVSNITDHPDWIYEVKYDGYRAVTKIADGEVEMVSRNGNSFNRQYASLIEELKKVKSNVILDGEVVIENENGVSSFQLLQNYTRTGKGNLKYYVFDILYLEGYVLTSLPLAQRKEILTEFFKHNKFKHVFESQFVVEKGLDLFKKYSTDGYEGIIAKEGESVYLPARRSPSWQKLKSGQEQEAIICGYTLPQNSRKYFGSLILGVQTPKGLQYAGNCGTGFTDASLKELHEKFEKLKTEKSPFGHNPVRGTKGKPVWLKPKLVCQVKFQEWTQENRMRVPVFAGLRTDKKATEVKKEIPASDKPSVRKKTSKSVSTTGEKEKILVVGKKEVKCTNLGKIFWPEEGITKGDLINYYQRIGKYILPYLKDRPQSLNRFPNGIKGPSFYQKDMEVKQLPEWAKTTKIYSKHNKGYIDYLLCNDEATLIYMANLACIEINPWHSKYTTPDHPDYIMIDLDPGKNPFTEVVDAALVVKEICDEIGIPCFCKTSGATGLHVYIPLGAKYTYDEVKLFAEILANMTQSRLPKTTTVERSIAKRNGKLYLDFLQNRKGQTIASVYSVRPKPKATVSTPLLWNEVNHRLSPEMFTIHTIEKRLAKKGDLWKGVLGKGISLPTVLKKLDQL